MRLICTFRRLACVGAFCFCVVLQREAHAVNEYFDINGVTAGSGAAASGTYNWDTGSGSNAWNTDAAGSAATPTAWPDGANFARFAAGTDAAASNYTVTVSANHTFAGMALQFNGGGTVTIANSGGTILTMFPNAAGQGFFVGTTGSTGTQGLTITAPIAGDASTPLFWNGAISGTSGSLFLYGNNTYAGGTVLNSSAGLNFNNANSFGTGPIAYNGTLTTAVLANPTVGNFTIANPLTMRSIAAANTTMIYTGIAPVTFSDWTLGSAGDTTHANILTVGNGTFTTAKMIINNLKGTDSNSNLTMTSGTGVNGTLVLTGTSTYGGITQIGGATVSTGLPTLQADDGSGLPSTSFLILNGGVLQTSGSFTRDINTSNNGGPRMEWGANGGGFSAIGGQLTVDIGANNGNAGLELPWTSTLGSGIVGPLKFGSITANAKTLFIDPIDLNNAGTAGLTRTVTVTAGAGGDSAEMNQIIRSSNGADTILQKNGTGTLILSAANTYTGTTQPRGGALQAADGTGLPTASLLSLDGGVFQGTGVTSFTRPLAGSGTSVQWTANGGGFSANGGQMTVNIGGAGAQLVWGATVGSQVVGPLIFGSNTANAKTLFVNPIDMNNSGVAASRTVTVNAGTGGDSAELSAVLSNSSGDATLTKNGAGTLLLSAANTYTGGTTVSAGTLSLGNVAALPSTGGLTLGGGTLSNVSGSGITIPNATTMTANSTLAGANGFTLNGSFTNSGANRTLTVSNTGGTTFNTLNLSEAAATGRTLTITGAGNTTFAGVIENASAAGAGNGALSFNTSYTGTATINGTNTYSGTTTLSTGGTFVLGNKAAFGTGTLAMNGVPVSASTDLSGANAIGNATVNFGGNNTFNGSNNIQFSGTVTATSSRTVTNNISTASLTFSGPVNLSSNATSNTLTLTGTGNTLISGAIANGGTSTASKLTKSGAGKLTVTGNNTYAGVTTVSAGTLMVNNDPTAVGNTSSGTGSGAVTIAVTATLGGTGRVGGALTIDGTVAPGATLGTLKVGGNVALDATSHTAIDFANGGLSDLLDITGNLTINSGAFLDLTGSGAGPWTIASYTGLLTGTFGANVTGLPSGYAVDYGTSGLIKIVSAGVAGDWNGDGHVDAADYVTWRTNPAGNGGDPAGYDTWRNNFGIAGSGAGIGSALNGGAVPEPSCIALALFGILALSPRRRFTLAR